MATSWNTSLPCALALLLPPLLVQAGVAGRIQFVVGDVRIVADDGTTKPALKGAEIQEKDSILTGSGAQAQIKMIDGALLALRPDTQLKLDAYVYNDAQAGTAWFTLLKGGLRSLTGLIGKLNQERYAIRTPNAVIGIRGTDHEPVVILPDTVIAQGNPAGTYDKVNVGMTSLTNAAGTTLIHRNQIGFASAPNQAPVLLRKMPDFYQTSPQLLAKSGKVDNADGKAEAQADANPPLASQFREEKIPSLLASDAPELESPEPSATPGNHLLTASNAAGAKLDTTAQSMADAAGVISIITNLTPTATPTPTPTPTPVPTPTPISTSQADVVMGFIASTTQLASYQAQAQAVASSMSNHLETLVTAQQGSISAQNRALTASTIATQSLSTASATTAAATSAGAPVSNTILQLSLNAISAGQEALAQIRLALHGDTNNKGIKNLQDFNNTGTQEFTRYLTNLQNWQSNNTEQTRSALKLDNAVLTAMTQQLGKADEIDLSKAASLLQQASQRASAAAAAAAAAQNAFANLPSTDPLYAQYRAATDDAVRAAKLAQNAAQAAQAAYESTQETLQHLSNVASNTPSSIGVENLGPAAKSLANGSPSAKLVASIDQHGNLVRGNATQSAGSSQSIYFAENAKPQLLDKSSHAATGLAWGRWQGGQIVLDEQYTDKDANGVLGLGAIDKTSGKFVVGLVDKNVTDQGQASLHWITGVNAEPKRLAQSLTGVANYTMLGGTTPTDNHGNTGKLNSAQLAANFSNQSVYALLNMSFGNNVWEFGEANIPLSGSRFEAQYCSVCVAQARPNGLSVLKKNGEQITPSMSNSLLYGASISGSLMGVGLSSAGIQYSVTEPEMSKVTDPLSGKVYAVASNHIMQGVVGFAGAKQDVSTNYRAISADDGSRFAYAQSARSGQEAAVNASIDFGSPAGRLLDSIRGMDEFVGSVRNYTPSETNPAHLNPAQENAATIKRGSAINTDRGSAQFGTTTVNWGRWQDGVVDIYSRDGKVKLGTINNQGRSLHWINTSATNENLATLPVTGSATYSVIGGTAPTDLKGNLGTLTNAKVDVDFSAMRANTSLGLSFNSADNTSTWSLDVKNTPFLRADVGFNSNSNNNGINGINGETHTVTCSGASCGNLNASAISGFFLGAGATGLGLTYDLFSGEKRNNLLTPRATAHGSVILRSVR